MAIYFIIIIFLLAVVLFLLMKSKNPNSGLFKYNKERAKEKEMHKEKVMEMLTEKGRVTNQETQGLLQVSDATATRYLEELEKEGKITQKGDRYRAYYEIT